MRLTSILAAVLVILPHVGTAGPVGRVLTLASAEERALQNDPALQPLRAGVDVARSEQRAARAIRDPEARLSYGDNSRAGADGTTGDESWDEYVYALRLFPPHPGVLGANRRAAQARVRFAEANVRAAEWQVVTEVRSLYQDIRYLEEASGLADRMVDARRVQHDVAKEKREQGVATSAEVTAAGLSHLEAVTARGEVERDLSQAKQRLAMMIGAPGQTDFALAEPSALPGINVSFLDAETVTEAILKQRADVVAIAWQLVAVQSQARAARNEKIPWLSHVQVSYQEEQGFQEDEAWRVQAAVALPLFSVLMPGADEVLAAEVKRWRSELMAARARVVQEIREALAGLMTASEHVRQYEREVGPLIEEMRVALAETGNAEDMGLDLRAQIEERIVAAEQALLDAHHARKQAWLRMEQVLGTDVSVLEDLAH
jgi:outer membrane protein TolC